MTNKKSRKLTNIMLSAMMLLGVSIVPATVYGAKQDFGKNGVAYILLPSDFASSGVYRLEPPTENKCYDPKRIFTISNMNKASGIAANQNKKVFLLSTNQGQNWADAEPGWLPNMSFDSDSPIYITAATPTDFGATHYIRSGCPHISNSTEKTGSYWKRNLSINGKTYKYAVQFGGPTGVKYLNGVSGVTGTPIWDGTNADVSSPTNSSARLAPVQPQVGTKIMLRSHFGALSYYLYGTKNEPAIQGLLMDGSNGRDTYLVNNSNGAGYFTGDSKHRAATMFACIVKRIYEKRTNTLDLFEGQDKTTNPDSPMATTNMGRTQSGVLETTDVKVKEYYGKMCGDNCIDGGALPANDLLTELSTVTVVTSTTGNRYGFNPLGKFNETSATNTNAALRVVKGGKTSSIAMASDAEGLNYSLKAGSSEYVVINAPYLASKNIKPNAIKTLGISSDFNSNQYDYIYGSDADKLVVQDSWWGRGGLAYEYRKGEEGQPGTLTKLDYIGKSGNPTVTELGNLSGKIDDIAIDGNGYLYVLKTVEFPSNSEMSNNPANGHSPASLSGNNTSFKVSTSSFTRPAYIKADSTNNFLDVTISGWKRNTSTTINGETINNDAMDVPNGQEAVNDYKEVRVKQPVYKAVFRYPEGTGSLGTEEFCGYLFVGYDTWVNNIRKTSAAALNWDFNDWQEIQGTKDSDKTCELAVVNVADAPTSVEGTVDHYLIVTGATTSEDGSTDFDSTGKASISEHTSLTFKPEGYKPIVNGTQTSFKEIGTISRNGNVLYSDLKLNTIPAADGTYAHDENNDGLKSGYPSNMFEASGKLTSVIYRVAKVEDLVPVDIDSAKRISDIYSQTVKSDSSASLSFTHQFKDPGRYIVQATVTYNYFNNFGTAERPYDLTCSTKTITTKPMLINVYANNLFLNQSETYITDINIAKTNKYLAKAGASESDFDVVEGVADTDDEKTFGSLTISFNAKFYREDNSGTVSNLQTYDGVGVWDYNYYKNLYANLKNSIPGIVIPTVSTTNHVYNYNSAANVNDLESSYKSNVYNPGKIKAVENNSYSYTAGTQVSGAPNKTDLQFIQYALYLRPTLPQGTEVATQHPLERGDLIKSGTFENAVVSGDKGERTYNISLEIADIDNLINTPRDPQDYVIDVEIIYPRVTWLNNDLGANLSDSRNYYSSVVPHTPGSNVMPIHILSKLNVDNSAQNINQSYESTNSVPLYETGVEPMFTLCVRDKKIPTFEDKTQNMPLIETTGDPSTKGTFNFVIADNNPFLSATKPSGDCKAAAVAITKEVANTAANLVFQEIKDSGICFLDDEENKKYGLRSSNDISQRVTSISFDNTKEFYKDDSWKMELAYEAVVPSVSPACFAPKASTNPNEEAKIREASTLEMENWVGSLNYAVVGKFFDGRGKDSKYTAHYLYDPTVYINKDDFFTNSSDLALDSVIPVTPKAYLTRIDNDPPSIEVELVSQTDNRRWVFQLIEGINDLTCKPERVEDLAESTLRVKDYYLKNNSNSDVATSVKTFADKKIPGNTSYPSEIGVATVKVTDVISDAVPSFRRAARLMINVNIFDNCGYLPLQEASIQLTNDGTDLLNKEIKLTASHNRENGLLKEEFDNKPRGVYVVDMPMQVLAGQPQLQLTVKAKDTQGNARTLIIPMNLVESSFETRVLETKENRD